jgi:hypothetical protein
MKEGEEVGEPNLVSNEMEIEQRNLMPIAPIVNAPIESKAIAEISNA